MEDRLRILLCEDDENLGMLLREYLQAKGFNADLYACLLYTSTDSTNINEKPVNC